MAPLPPLGEQGPYTESAKSLTSRGSGQPAAAALHAPAARLPRQDRQPLLASRWYLTPPPAPHPGATRSRGVAPMPKRVTIALTSGLLASAALTGQAAAQAGGGFNYTFIEGGLASQEYNAGRKDQDLLGTQIAGSLALAPGLFAVADYEYLNDDLSTTSASIGPGAHLPAAAGLDFYATVTLEYLEYDWDDRNSEDDTGFGVTAGVRYALMQRTEINGEIEYVDVDEVTGDELLNLYATALYELAPRIEGVGELRINDVGEEDNLGALIGARYNF
ncbi:hypothetical protein CKO13_08105 [Halorhodospira neutriphila]|uniref:Outer membrane protein beta-barrel domain-containing protein n=2 Tax=Halorhodospira neutriphila TaxID=168379 RepID=A0ABS1EA29_9GAMM|nr:hypothetical protein [Halorhodospira neutriphila]